MAALGLLAMLAPALATAQGQSFEWRDVTQLVNIDPDGRVTVVDTRTLWTDGDFGEAFICLELATDQSLTMLPESGALDDGPRATAFTQPCSAGMKLVVQNADRVSERRVRFAYALGGTVDFYSDVVQWYWNLIQLEHPPIDGYRLVVTAPGGMAAPYDAFVHRYENPEEPLVWLSDDRSVLVVTFDSVPSGDGVEVRYLMDPKLFDVSGDHPGLQELLEDESKLIGG